MAALLDVGRVDASVAVAATGVAAPDADRGDAGVAVKATGETARAWRRVSRLQMDPDVKETRPSRSPSEPNMFLQQWGRRKRLGCVNTRDDGSPSSTRSQVLRRTIWDCPLLGGEVAQFRSPHRPSSLHPRKSETLVGENRHSVSLSSEKHRYYSTRVFPGFDFCGGMEEKVSAAALPRFSISLSSKEIEEDFLAIKGSKLPQRPKLMHKCLPMVCAGAWLSDLWHEKKSSRKRAWREIRSRKEERAN